MATQIGSPLRLGYLEMTLVPHMVSRVMKSKSTLLVCIMDIAIGHLKSGEIPTTQQLLEGDSRFSRELAKVAMELSIKNMIFLWIRVSIKLNS